MFMTFQLLLAAVAWAGSASAAQSILPVQDGALRCALTRQRQTRLSCGNSPNGATGWAAGAGATARGGLAFGSVNGSATQQLDTLVTPRVALAALLQACLADDGSSSTTPRPLRIVGPRLLLLDSLASRADLFIETTGINVAFDLPSFGVYTQRRASLLLDRNPPNATYGYDAIVVSPTAFGDAAQVPGKLLDISRLVSGDPSLSDILPAFRAAAMYDGGVMAIPLVPAPFLLFYRLDIFQRDNLTVPQTWEQFADLAERYHNGPDGLVGSCVIPIGASCRAESLFFRALLSSYIQTEGPSHGVAWDAETMRPLLNSEAGAQALTIFRRLTASGPTWSHAPECVQNDFNKGRCFMSIGHGSRFKDGNLGSADVTRARGRMGIAPHPGTTRVLDRATLKLVPCDKERCPLAEEVVMEDGLALVNRPVLLQSTVVMLNGLSPLQYQFYAFGLFSMLSSSSLLGVGGGSGLLLDPNELLPMRPSDFSSDQLKYWVQEGYDAGDAERFLAVYRKTATSENIVPEIKIRLSTNITSLLYAAAVTFNNPATNATALPAILARMESALDAIVAAEGGKDAFAAQYRRSLNWVPKTATTAGAAGGTGDPQTGAAGPSSDSSSSSQTMVALAVAIPCGCAVLAAAALALYVRRRQQRKARNAGGSADSLESAPGVSADTTCLTLVVTDIYESTTLWEKLPAAVMDAAVSTHHAVMRQALAFQNGYESATEGDAFICSFKGPADAAAFCLHVQQALLEASWPVELMQHRDLEALACGPGDGVCAVYGDWLASAAAASPTATVTLLPCRGSERAAAVGAGRSSRRLGLTSTFKRLATGKRAEDRSTTGRDRSLSSRRSSVLTLGASTPSFVAAATAAAAASPRIAAACKAVQGSSFVFAGAGDRSDPALGESCGGIGFSSGAGGATAAPAARQQQRNLAAAGPLASYNTAVVADDCTPPQSRCASMAGMGGGCSSPGVRALMDLGLRSLPSPFIAPATATAAAAGGGAPRMQAAAAVAAGGSTAEWTGACVSSRTLLRPPAVWSPMAQSLAATAALSPAGAAPACLQSLKRTSSEGSAAAAIAELVAAGRTLMDTTQQQPQQQLSTILDDDMLATAALGAQSAGAGMFADGGDAQQVDGGSTGPCDGSSSAIQWTAPASRAGAGAAPAAGANRSKARGSSNGSALLDGAAAAIFLSGKANSDTASTGADSADVMARAAATGVERRRAQSVRAMLLGNQNRAASSLGETAAAAALHDVETTVDRARAAAAARTTAALVRAGGSARETCGNLLTGAADEPSLGSSSAWATETGVMGGSSLATTNTLSVATARTPRLLPGSLPQQALDIAGSCDGAAFSAAAATAGARTSTFACTSLGASAGASRKRLLRASMDLLLLRQRAPSASQQQHRPPSLQQGLAGAWVSVANGGGGAGASAAGSPGSSMSRAAAGGAMPKGTASPMDDAAAVVPHCGNGSRSRGGLSPFAALSLGVGSGGRAPGGTTPMRIKNATPTHGPLAPAVWLAETLAEQLQCAWATTAAIDGADLGQEPAMPPATHDAYGPECGAVDTPLSVTQQTFDFDDGSGQGYELMSPQSTATLSFAHKRGGAAAGAMVDGGCVTPSKGQATVFRGLRVRMGIHSSGGAPSEVVVSRNAASGRVQYSGALLRLAKAVSDVGQGGMILLSQATRDALQQAAEGESAAALQKALGGPFVVLWMGKHTFSDGAGDAHLYQIISMPLVGRLAWQLQQPQQVLLRKCVPVPPLGGGVFDAPAAGLGTLARISVVGASTLMAWNAEATARALAQMHEMLLGHLSRCLSVTCDAVVEEEDASPGVDGSVRPRVGSGNHGIYVMEGAEGLLGFGKTTGRSGRSIAAKQRSIFAAMSPRKGKDSAQQLAAQQSGPSISGRHARGMPSLSVTAEVGNADGSGNTLSGEDASRLPSRTAYSVSAPAWLHKGSHQQPRTSFTATMRHKLQAQLAANSSSSAGAGPGGGPGATPVGQSVALRADPAAAATVTPPSSHTKLLPKHSAPGAMTVAWRGAPAEAVHWLLSCLASLPHMDWPTELLEHPLAEEAWFDGPEGQQPVLHWRGLRATGVVAWGEVSGCLELGMLSGHMSYQHSQAWQALKRVTAASQVGKVVVSSHVAASIPPEQLDHVVVVKQGPSSRKTKRG